MSDSKCLNEFIKNSSSRSRRPIRHQKYQVNCPFHDTVDFTGYVIVAAWRRRYRVFRLSVMTDWDLTDCPSPVYRLSADKSVRSEPVLNVNYTLERNSHLQTKKQQSKARCRITATIALRPLIVRWINLISTSILTANSILVLSQLFTPLPMVKLWTPNIPCNADSDRLQPSVDRCMAWLLIGHVCHWHQRSCL